MKILANGIAIIEGDTHIGRWVEESGQLTDPNMVPRIARFIRAGDLVVDGGANIGRHTSGYLKAGARVLAFEPNPAAFACLTHNCPKAVALQLALSDRLAWHALNIDPNAGKSWLSRGNDVLAVPLDCLALDQCCLIRLDVEGFEPAALRGMIETIERFHPVLAIEINDETLARQSATREDVFNFLKTAGYHWRNLYEDALDLGLQGDIIATHTQSAAP